MTDRANELLVFAAMANDADLILERLAAADDLDFQYRNKGSALHQAAMKGNVRIASLLIDAGADVNLKHQEWAKTPLDLARELRLTDMIDLLTRHGGAATTPLKEYDSAAVKAAAAPAGDEYAFAKPTTYEGALAIDALPAHFARFLNECEIHCVAGCCGLDAFSFSAPVVRAAAVTIGTEAVSADIGELLARLRSSEATTVVSERMNAYIDRADFIAFLEALSTRMPEHG